MITTRFSEYEVTLLASLIDQLIEVVAEGEPDDLVEEPAPADPFEAWDRELSEPAPPPAEPVAEAPDPVLGRLFPDAYPDDPNASADFRRFTQRELRSKKVTEARFVLERLVETQGGSHDIAIPLDEVDIWLRTLTGLRLAVAIRLGISDASDADEVAGLDDSDPRAFMASVYDWLGFAEETLVSALS
jgi:hypothetical protein